MTEINLEQEKKSLEARIDDLNSRMAPIQKELNELRARLSHVIGLMPIGNVIHDDEPGRGFWSKLCRENNWFVGRDSAHRVVLRKDHQLHNSIPHLCIYDRRLYP